jgi:hypothetical protein
MALSSDKFWEQWSAGTSPGGQPGEAEKKPEPAATSSSVDDDILAAWLKALPPNEMADSVGGTPTPAANPAELAALWPPAAPVDPFAGMSQTTAGSAAAADWDLALDLDATGSVPAPLPPAAPAPPLAPPPSPAAPAPAAGSGLGDFSAGLGGLAGPVPAANPFAPPAAGGVPPPPVAPAGIPGIPPPAAVSPFGPPVPPAAPPQESLSAPLLRVEVRTGRRATEVDIKGEGLIGRPDATRGIHPEIDLRLDDAVSRRHAKIFIRGDHYVLTDLNSTNGTRLNGQWVPAEAEVPLKAGDEIEVGELTVIRVLEAPNSNA